MIASLGEWRIFLVLMLFSFAKTAYYTRMNYYKTDLNHPFLKRMLKYPEMPAEL